MAEIKGSLFHRSGNLEKNPGKKDPQAESGDASKIVADNIDLSFGNAKQSFQENKEGQHQLQIVEDVPGLQSKPEMLTGRAPIHRAGSQQDLAALTAGVPTLTGLPSPPSMPNLRGRRRNEAARGKESTGPRSSQTQRPSLDLSLSPSQGRWGGTPGVWTTSRNFDYILTGSGEVFYQPLQPWAYITFASGDPSPSDLQAIADQNTEFEIANPVSPPSRPAPAVHLEPISTRNNSTLDISHGDGEPSYQDTSIQTRAHIGHGRNDVWDESLKLVLHSYVDKKSYSGRLSADGGKALWNDGDMWTLIKSVHPKALLNEAIRTELLSKSNRRSRTLSSTNLLSRSEVRKRRPRRHSTTQFVSANRRLNLLDGNAAKAGIAMGTTVYMRSLTDGEEQGSILGIGPDGRYRIQVRDVEGKSTRVLSAPLEALRLSPSTRNKGPGLPLYASESRISQVENSHYTHAFVRVLTSTTGIPITHSGVLVETKIRGKPVYQTVLDVIEYNKRPYIARRHYMQHNHFDTWEDSKSRLLIYRRNRYDQGSKPWSKTRLSGKPVSYRVWESKSDDKSKAKKAHNKWVDKIHDTIKEGTQGEFKIISRNCQHVAAYTMNKLKAEAGVTDERNATPPNWVFRIFTPESVWVPQDQSSPTIREEYPVLYVPTPPGSPLEPVSPSQVPPSPPVRRLSAVSNSAEPSKTSKDAPRPSAERPAGVHALVSYPAPPATVPVVPVPKASSE